MNRILRDHGTLRSMLLRLFRVAVVVGLLALAAECLNLSHSLSELVQMPLADWPRTLDR
ncbi:MAG TPA: hypothetical protein VGI28_13930 [Stellaceae bacterium]